MMGVVRGGWLLLLAGLVGAASSPILLYVTATISSGGYITPVASFPDCPVTPPVLADPPEPEQPAPFSRDPLGLDWWYVSDDGLLWTGALPYRETGGEKVLWLKPIGSRLSVSGQPLDDPDTRLTAQIPGGYGGDYHATGITFPLPGCWEIVARAGESELRFVTFVVEAGTAPRSGDP